ncbi:tRNA (guanosine(46)-N7)-methyltransferase TrmB [Rarobacter incanus]|uniref:tRNA (guanine-N(7)-)-methyltransferase n=1 Tax=Rarobacter incanus TaxID=153494 RepID=A0A542SRR1_9MICO|nr:tRNA (guanosine(46)-N7)-methyltransferase TrmB [Rarobacter incanus]TQK77301.1 tRNA (guanine-N7-)-methyltransferase [Rarobacter incanus]
MNTSPGDQAIPRRQIRSYVQRSSRLGPRLQGHWDKYGPRYLVDLPRDSSAMGIDPDFRWDPQHHFARPAQTILEIGSGRGETIAHAAAQLPATNFIGCEVYAPGVAGILGRAGQADLDNVAIVHADATTLLEATLPAGSISELWVFFPDPWHKSRHHKRRLISDSFADLAARVLKAGGTWRIATDWPDYADQIGQVIRDSSQFEGGPTSRFDLRPLTRFEAKAHDEGRSVTDFAATRR